MKKIKEAMCAFLVCAVVVMAFSCANMTPNGTADSGAKRPDGKNVLKILAYGGEGTNDFAAYFANLTAEFESLHPDVKIEYEIEYGDSYHQRVWLRLVSGDVPHVAYMSSSARWISEWKLRGQLFDMRPYVDTSFFDMSLIPDMGESGEIYYIPLGTSNSCSVLYVNTQLLDELGFSMPGTYEDLKAMVPAARAAGIEVLATHGADAWAWGSCVMSALLARTTGRTDYMTALMNGSKKFTDADVTAAFAFLKTMADDGVLSVESLTRDSGAGLVNYSNGKNLIYITGQWDSGNITYEAQTATAFMAFPTIPGQKGADTMAAAPSVGYGITQAAAEDSVVLDAAISFVQFFNSRPKVLQRWADGAIVAPILKNYTVPENLPPLTTSKADLAKMVECDVIDTFLFGAPNDALITGMQKIVAGTATPQAVAVEIERLMNR